MQELSDVSGLCQDLGVGVLVNEVNQVYKDPLNVADLIFLNSYCVDARHLLNRCLQRLSYT